MNFDEALYAEITKQQPTLRAARLLDILKGRTIARQRIVAYLESVAREKLGISQDAIVDWSQPGHIATVGATATAINWVQILQAILAIIESLLVPQS